MITTESGADPEDRASANVATTIVPCSQAQQRFWFEERLHPGNPGLNVAVRWRIDGDLCDEHLAEAWRRIVARHQTLRTSLAVQDEEIVQVVHSEATFNLSVVDLRMLPEHEAAAEADRLASEAARTPFDLAVAPLIRVMRVRLTDDVSILVVTAHHTMCDGLSIGILARETGTICAALQAGREPELPAIPLSYGEYAAWEREWLAGADLKEETAFSRRLLDGYKQFELPTDHPRPAVQTSNGDIATVLLDRDLTNRLTAVAQDNGCTLFMLAYASLLVLLHRYSGETDIALGTQVVGRDEPELQQLVGCFINTIALRTDLSGDPTFLQLLARVRDTVLETFEVRHFPLERLIEVANPKRDLSRNSLFSINFIFQRSFIKNETYGRFSLTDLPSRSAGALYDLNFFMVERPEGWRASCEYNTDLFEGTTVQTLLDIFQTLLRTIGKDPTLAIGALPILDDAVRQKLVVACNRTEADYPADRTLPQLFEERAALAPDKIALVCGDRTLTYAELSRESDAVASELRRRGCAPGSRVGIFLHRSADLVVALLGVMKSGSAYVPLDPGYPPERLATIAEDAKLAGLITRLGLEYRLPLTGASIILIDSLKASPLAVEPEADPRPADAAYVIYTSGSTGRPKGVAVSHQALVNFLWSMRREPGLSSADRLVAVTTISFDIAGLELYLPLVTGATLVIAAEEALADGASLLRLLDESRATVMQATPVTWQLLIDAGWSGTPKLRVLCGGEAIPRALADRLLDRSDDVWNMYGPTETTIWSSAVRIRREAGSVPIGPPIANTQFYVLDAHGELAPPGAPGELYIGGDGVAIGYFGAEQLTAERFVPDTFSARPGAKMYRTGDLVRRRDDGRFDFMGRTDHQIKLRGFRIELGEIEAILLAQPGVADAVVVASTDEAGDKAIVAYAVPREPRTGAAGADQAWSDALRAHLALALPGYMVPAIVVALDALPRTPNGKIDRKSLPEPARTERVTIVDETSLTSTEIALTAMIAKLLRRSSLGPNDDIFALGFHSLLAVRLVARVAQSFGVTLPLRALFSHPNVRGLAGEIDALRGSNSHASAVAPIVTLNGTGLRTPFTFLHSDLFSEGLYCRRLAAALGPSQPIHAVAPHGSSGLPKLGTIEAMARDYFERLRAVQPHGPYLLGGFCVGGLVAYELARLLRESGEVVDDVLLINSSALPTRAIPLIDTTIRRIGLDARLSVRIRERLTYSLARLHAALVQGPKATAALAVWQVTSILRRKKRAHLVRMVDPGPFTHVRGTPVTENAFAHIAAALTYHPRPYDGAVTLLWGAEQNAVGTDATVGWGTLARDVRVVPVGGGHVTVLHAGVGELATTIESILNG